MSLKYDMKATTILIVRHNKEVVIGADSQGTIGSYIANDNVNKIRTFRDKSICMGFAGVAKDGIALFETLEGVLKMYNYNLQRACFEIAKKHREPTSIGREAVVLIANNDHTFRFTGSGELTRAEDVCSVGSGSSYALSAAKALLQHASHLSAKEIVEIAMNIAGKSCAYTNLNIKIEVINPKPAPDKRSVLPKSDLPREVGIATDKIEKTTKATVKKTVRKTVRKVNKKKEVSNEKKNT
ncbi:MAG: ATP-dependent protease subunit HslV [Pseudomonadota bacterium]